MPEPISKSIHSIMDTREFKVVFQPILDLGKGVMHGYEALIRGPEGTPFEYPDQLFAAAHYRGRHTELNFLAAEVIVETFLKRRLPGKLFLNMSPGALATAERNQAEDLFGGLGLNSRRIVIELTEQVGSKDSTLLIRNVTFYKSLGFEVALDDLGQGFSGLSMWLDLRPEYVKADKKFVSGATANKRQRMFVEAIQGLAEDTGTTLVAEGIETLEELQFVHDLAIGCGQGYYIGKPSSFPAAHPSDEVLQALQSSAGLTQGARA